MSKSPVITITGQDQVRVAFIGPMRDEPDWNYPVFDEVEQAWLRLHPNDVTLNPAKSFGGSKNHTFPEYMGESLKNILSAQMVVLLPGWEASEGSNYEVNAARCTGKIFYQAYRHPLGDEMAWEWGFRNIDPPKPTRKDVILEPSEAEVKDFQRLVESGEKSINWAREQLGLKPFEGDFATGGLVRTFESGATRDTDEGKLDFEGFFSPDVIECFAEYMHMHRKRSDGTLRAADDWQAGMPRSVYMKSLWRHFFEVWKIHRTKNSTIEDEWSRLPDALCGVIFNAMGYLHEIQNDRDLPAV